MDIYGKFVRSWRLFEASVSVILRRPKLLVFPLLTGMATVFIVLFFLSSFVLAETGAAVVHGGTWSDAFKSLGGAFSADGGRRVRLDAVSAVAGALLYLVSMFLATFSNVAFYHEILAALRGDAVSVRRGVRFAASRLRAILFWTLFAGLIGLLIKAVEERLEFVGRLLAKLLGMAWSLASVFAIPALVCEDPDATPLTLLKHSAETLRRTWGEALIGYAGLSFGGGVAALGSVVMLGGAAAISFAVGNFWILAAVGVVWLAGFLAFSYLGNVAGQVYKAALYLYASEGVVADPFDQGMFRDAWRMKKA